jgi:erythromycin esterase
MAGVTGDLASTPAAAQVGIATPGAPRDEILGWIREKAIPLATVEAGNGFADLEQLRRIIGDARIVSLGEATHGTREFLQLKHRLLEFCVSELGFTLFGIEANYPESLRVNDYVLHGSGNAAEALAGMRFWTWDTEEVLALIEWMRAWNITHERKVKFYGFDMQSPTEAALGVIDYLKRVAPELAAASEEPLWPLSDDFSADRFRLLASETRNSALTSIGRILEAFAHQRAAWVEATGELGWGLARLRAAVLDQGARLALTRSYASFALRDVAMAQNVRSLLEIEGPDAKAVLWAHNGHVARATPYVADDKTLVANMGSHLHEMFGRQHLVVGFAFNQGSFQAMESGRGLVDHTVQPAPEGSLDQMLVAAAIPRFLLELATAPAAGPVADWLLAAPVAVDWCLVFCRKCAGISEPRRPAQHLRCARVRGDDHGGARQALGASTAAVGA